MLRNSRVVMNHQQQKKQQQQQQQSFISVNTEPGCKGQSSEQLWKREFPEVALVSVVKKKKKKKSHVLDFIESVHLCGAFLCLCVCVSLSLSLCCRLESGGVGRPVCNFLCITLALRHYGQGCQFVFFSFFYRRKMRSKNTHPTQRRSTQVPVNGRAHTARSRDFGEHILVLLLGPRGLKERNTFSSLPYLL